MPVLSSLRRASSIIDLSLSAIFILLKTLPSLKVTSPLFLSPSECTKKVNVVKINRVNKIAVRKFTANLFFGRAASL